MILPDSTDFCKCVEAGNKMDSFVMKLLFHHTRMNSLWQLNGLDQLCSYDSCVQSYSDMASPLASYIWS